MTTIGVYAGSFDPITLGHLSVIDQAVRAFDQVIVAVGHNSAKQGVFDVDQRMAFIRDSVGEHVRVVSFQGLLASYCDSLGSNTKKVSIVRGLRAVSDFESEMAIAHTNGILTNAPTVFFPTAPALSFVSSSAARELAKHNVCETELFQLVPEHVALALLDKYQDD